MATAGYPKRFRKQSIQKAEPREIIKFEDMDEFVADVTTNKMIKVREGRERHSDSEKDTVTDSESECEHVNTTKYSVVQMLNNHIRHESVIWFEPVRVTVGTPLKSPTRSEDMFATVSFDLFANISNQMNNTVTIPAKSFRQIGTGFALRTEMNNSLNPHVSLCPNWYGQVVSTPLHNSRGIFHGSAPIDPRQCDCIHSNREITATLFNMSSEDFVVCNRNLIGRLILNACHVPGVIDHPPSLLQLRFNGTYNN
jgi:hypothetical protein